MTLGVGRVLQEHSRICAKKNYLTHPWANCNIEKVWPQQVIVPTDREPWRTWQEAAEWLKEKLGMWGQLGLKTSLGEILKVRMKTKNRKLVPEMMRQFCLQRSHSPCLPPVVFLIRLHTRSVFSTGSCTNASYVCHEKKVTAINKES